MAIKKSDLYSSLWQSCDELRGGMDASQYKDYVLFMLFIKYITDKYGDSTDFAPPVTMGVPPKLIIFNGFLVGAGAQHCQGQIRQRDRFATTMTIPTRNGDFGATRAGSEWPAPRAHSTACPNA